ncbi:hypothetical protein ABXN37_11505 [Piscinibacter sakaiensis]|uniref:Exonuclease domain-containing protein n=1 Tax=Piscinibacter sakaiensis TaxID=1547922 RepID=A0A0K8NZG6_PISS1|nr:hypothetical protein [Piscinibacter sakaiensis]GAP35773.1 hypothetical protein ISF6_1546 [Piscinibacter sakaiensis]
MSRDTPSPPAILDVEASGFGRDSYPIEVGYVLPDGRARCTLIRPAPGWVHWDPQAEAVHHIPREAVLRHGREVGDVARWLNEELGGLTVYTDGWAHDYPWLSALFEEAGCSWRFKLDSLRSLLDEQEATHWHALKQQVGRELKLERHRASADARLLQSTYLRLKHPP